MSEQITEVVPGDCNCLLVERIEGGERALERRPNGVCPTHGPAKDWPWQPIPKEWAGAANSARGLCESEANRWEKLSPKTAEHWRRVSVGLGAIYLTQDHLQKSEHQVDTTPTPPKETQEAEELVYHAYVAARELKDSPSLTLAEGMAKMDIVLAGLKTARRFIFRSYNRVS